jgi:hypothetical protein
MCSRRSWFSEHDFGWNKMSAKAVKPRLGKPGVFSIPYTCIEVKKKRLNQKELT